MLIKKAHKESIEVALAEDGISGEVRHYGKIGGTFDAVDKLLRKLVSLGKTLHFCYEAGPTGYELHRHLTNNGHTLKNTAATQHYPSLSE